MEKWKSIALAEIVVILILAGFLLHHTPVASTPEDGLLSPRIYKGILEPESRLIFSFKPLERSLQNYTEHENATIALYVSNLRDGASMGINEEMEFEPASLNKIPLAILVMRDIEKGAYTLEDEMTIKEEDVDTHSGTLYEKVGQPITVRDLVHAMLSESDNTAFKVLNQRVTQKDWETLSEYLNYYNLKQDKTSKEKDLLYTTTPEANARIFTSLYLSTLLNAEHSELILKDLENSTFNVESLARLPPEVRVVQKLGTYYYSEEKYYHRCGILYLPEGGRFFYCIMTSGASSKEAEKIIGDSVNMIYTYVTETKANLERAENL
jgi:beta-lactamase class A